jgi:hypothetical protein
MARARQRRHDDTVFQREIADGDRVEQSCHDEVPYSCIWSMKALMTLHRV